MLQRLDDAGFRVPPFDALAASLWTSEGSARDLRQALSVAATGKSNLSVYAACERAKRLIRPTVSARVREYVEHSRPFDRLGPHLSARSSALGEDGADYSAAGQYESVLGVTDPDALGAAALAVVDSYLEPRAVLYRRRASSRPHAVVGMGLVVQRQVAARVAGVCFSAPPRQLGGASGFASNEAIVEASTGLGTCVVSGETTPDRFAVKAGSQAIRRLLVGDKRIVDHVNDDGSISRVDRGACSEPALAPDEAREIAELAWRVGDLLGVDVDIEWAIDADTLWLLQARPITSASRAGGSDHSISEVY